jgi:hypothetical protein
MQNVLDLTVYFVECPESKDFAFNCASAGCAGPIDAPAAPCRHCVASCRTNKQIAGHGETCFSASHSLVTPATSHHRITASPVTSNLATPVMFQIQGNHNPLIFNQITSKLPQVLGPCEHEMTNAGRAGQGGDRRTSCRASAGAAQTCSDHSRVAGFILLLISADSWLIR